MRSLLFSLLVLLSFCSCSTRGHPRSYIISEERETSKNQEQAISHHQRELLE